ncbi:MAG: hypothetical protein ACYC8T_34705 [Myxococcaceae bacterium]
MRHVIVETNWVVDAFAPRHVRAPAAVSLLDQAVGGAHRLYVPAVSLTEATSVLRRKFQPKVEDLRKFRSHALSNGALGGADDSVIGKFLNRYSTETLADLDAAGPALDALRAKQGVEVFPLDDDIFKKVLGLRELALEPFDETILGAVLHKAAQLKRDGVSDPVHFATLDTHLLPWRKDKSDKPELKRLYDELGIVVHASFILPPESP